VTPDGTYLVPISDDPSGTGRLKKITLTNLLSLVESGVTDHGALTGLADDDHLQYVAKDGRENGQAISGGTGSGEALDLNSTAHATKGDVRFNNNVCAFDASGNLFVGTQPAAT